MASNSLKEMGNKESLNSAENESACVAQNGETKPVQERAIHTGKEKIEQNNVTNAFKYDTGLNARTPAQFLKSVDARKSSTDAQRSQSQQVASHAGFNHDINAGKEFLQNYGGLQQPMFTTPGYVNGSPAITRQMIPPMLVQQPMHVPSSVPGMFQPGFMYQTLPAEPQTIHPKSHYFPPFTKGSLIMLSTGGLKPIEDLSTSDFIESAKVSKQLSLETCKIAKLQDVPNRGVTLIGFAVEDYEKEVLVEKPSDHPFYVYEQGWSSFRPDATLIQYGLPCKQLKVGDVCVFLSDRIDDRSDKTQAGLVGKTSKIDDAVGRKLPNCGEANKSVNTQPAPVNAQPAVAKDFLSRDQQSVGKAELGCKKAAPLENVEQSDGFGKPVAKKAKLDAMDDKTIQDAAAK